MTEWERTVAKLSKTYSSEYCPPELKDVLDVSKTRSHMGRAYPKLYKIAADLAINDTWAEFGVGCGYNTTKVLRDNLSKDGTLYLFDSWTGIPEPWKLSETLTEPAGRWKFPQHTGVLLQEKDNRLIITDGFFEKTLPYQFREQLGLINIDCDLYSSTRDILFGALEYIQEGTVIIFDELIGYQCYEDHEYKALMEWLEETGYKMEWHAKESFAAVGVVT